MGLRYALLFLIITIFSSCDYYLINSYDQRIGHIEAGTGLGNPDFAPCLNDVLLRSYTSYKPLGYAHGRDSLKFFFISHYDNQGITNESGYLTFRFIINCKGEIGNFEIHQMGIDYKEKKFHSALIDKLMKLLNQLQEWKVYTRGDSKFDCFSHITFKIENGELVEILP